MKNRYAMLTVDTEALPKRATADHVKRLIWGEHESGTAGIREMCAIGDEFGVKHVFFVDLCGAYASLSQMRDVVRWLDAAGQDVQLHTHPEYLPDSFWSEHALSARPRHMNKYTDDARAEFVIKHFGNLISEVTGKPILAHRAGSFRWNASTIRALKAAGVPLSFNNSMCAYYAKQCGFSLPTNTPYIWSNDVIEVPVTEKKVLRGVAKEEWWTRLSFPETAYFKFRPWWGAFLMNLVSDSPDFAVLLMHSWSLLSWDEDGHAAFQNEKRQNEYRKLVRRISKNYDIITTADFLDLQARGLINVNSPVDLSMAELASQTSKKQ